MEMIISLAERSEQLQNLPTPTTSRDPKVTRFCVLQAQQISRPGRGSHCCELDTVRNFCHLRNIPLFIMLISLIETVVYFAADDTLKEILLYDAANRRQLWRFFTYMLLHTNELHLGLNVLIQGFLGTPLELEQGRLRCAVIYFGGGLAGSLVTSACAAFSLMAGASGGVYALLTAHIPNVVLNHAAIKYARHRIAVVTVLIAADVAYVFFRVHFYNNEKPKIGWVAHAAGAAAGILLGFLTFQGPSKWKRKFQTASCAALALPFIFIIALSFLPSRFHVVQ